MTILRPSGGERIQVEVKAFTARFHVKAALHDGQYQDQSIRSADGLRENPRLKHENRNQEN